MTTVELRQKRAALVEQARAIYNKAESESRSMTAEETQTFDRMMTDVDEIAARVERLEKLTSAEEEQTASRGRQVPDGASSNQLASQDALRAWLLLGSPVMPSSDQLRAMQTAGLQPGLFSFQLRSDSLRSANPDEFRAWQARALAAGTPNLGGYTVAQGFSGEVERAMLAFGGMRKAARILRTAQGNDIPWPITDDTAAQGEQIAENAEMSERDITFGSKTLKAYNYSSKIVRVSLQLVQDSAVNIEEIVGSMIGESIARKTEPLFASGNGTTEPEGAVTAATSSGVTAASQTSVTYDELLDLVHSVDVAYRDNGAKFMFHDTTLRALKGLKDSEGRPLWKAGLAVGSPDTIDGYQYVVNNSMPHGAGTKSILFGDFSRFIIRDVSEVVVQTLRERFIEFGQIALLALSRHDSRLLDAGQHPIKYLTQAA